MSGPSLPHILDGHSYILGGVRRILESHGLGVIQTTTRNTVRDGALIYWGDHFLAMLDSLRIAFVNGLFVETVKAHVW